MTYECDSGFVLEGPKYRHCQGDMWWGPTDSVPYCAKEGIFVNWTCQDDHLLVTSLYIEISIRHRLIGVLFLLCI